MFLKTQADPYCYMGSVTCYLLTQKIIYFSSEIKLPGHSVFYLLNLVTLLQGQIVTFSPSGICMFTMLKFRLQMGGPQAIRGQLNQYISFALQYIFNFFAKTEKYRDFS